MNSKGRHVILANSTRRGDALALDKNGREARAGDEILLGWWRRIIFVAGQTVDIQGVSRIFVDQYETREQTSASDMHGRPIAIGESVSSRNSPLGKVTAIVTVPAANGTKTFWVATTPEKTVLYHDYTLERYPRSPPYIYETVVVPVYQCSETKDAHRGWDLIFQDGNVSDPDGHVCFVFRRTATR